MAKKTKQSNQPNMFPTNPYPLPDDRIEWDENEQRQKVLDDNAVQKQFSKKMKEERISKALMENVSQPDKIEPVYQKVVRISQSLMKAVREYLDGGECGILIREKYIKGRLFDDATKAMKLGTYFEYVLTGALPKGGKVPQPEYMKSKINANIKAKRQPLEGLGIVDMYDPYREAHENAKNVLKMWDYMGLKIAEDSNGKKMCGLHLTKGRFDGVIDVVLEATKVITLTAMTIDGHVLKEKAITLQPGDRINGDIKYSGMRDDKWSVHGWQWVDIQKKYHGTQAKQYKFLIDYPQTFWVVDPKGNYILFFWCDIDQAAIDAHLEEGNELYKRLQDLEELGELVPRPEYNKCSECPMNAECTYKHTHIHPVIIDLTMGN